MSYAWEKLYTAILCLVGSGNQRERLVHAYLDSLIRLKPEDLPEEIRDEFRKVEHNITRFEPRGNEGSVQAIVSKMSDGEVEQFIEQIVSLYDTVTRHEEPF